MCIVESLNLKRYGYMGLASACPIDVQTLSLVLTNTEIRLSNYPINTNSSLVCVCVCVCVREREREREREKEREKV